MNKDQILKGVNELRNTWRSWTDQWVILNMLTGHIVHDRQNVCNYKITGSVHEEDLVAVKLLDVEKREDVQEFIVSKIRYLRGRLLIETDCGLLLEW